MFVYGVLGRGIQQRRDNRGIPTTGRAPLVVWPEGVNEGSVICYGPSFDEIFQQWGRLIGKVLRGAKPGELPVEQPTSFKLAINLKLARQLAITVPTAMLQRADEVLE